MYDDFTPPKIIKLETGQNLLKYPNNYKIGEVMQNYLLASSYSIKGLLVLIDEFYFSNGNDAFKIEGEKVIRIKDNKIMTQVKVVKKRDRYRLESKN